MLSTLGFLPNRMRLAFLRRHVRFREREIAGLRAGLASCPEDALAAGRLVHDAYTARGLIDPHPSRVRVVFPQLLPSSFILVAKDGPRVVGTVTLQTDSEVGIPMENERGFRSKVLELRRRGRFVAEVGALAVAPEYRRTGVFHLLNRAMFEVAESVGASDLLIAVSRWAKDVYRAVLCFDVLGDADAYPGLSRSTPATALRLPLDEARDRLRERAPQSYAVYLKREWHEIDVPSALSLEHHDPARLSAVRALVASRPDVVRSLSHRQYELLRARVPDIYWPRPSWFDPAEVVPLSSGPPMAMPLAAIA